MSTERAPIPEHMRGASTYCERHVVDAVLMQWHPVSRLWYGMPVGAALLKMLATARVAANDPQFDEPKGVA